MVIFSANLWARENADMTLSMRTRFFFYRRCMIVLWSSCNNIISRIHCAIIPTRTYPYMFQHNRGSRKTILISQSSYKLFWTVSPFGTNAFRNTYCHAFSVKSSLFKRARSNVKNPRDFAFQPSNRIVAQNIQRIHSN